MAGLYRALTLMAVLITVVVAFPVASAAWDLGGNLVNLADWSPIDTVIIDDGDGGTYLAWVDIRNGSWEAYGQHLDGDGNALWAAGGVLLSDDIPGVYGTRLMLADDGGLWVSWARGGLHVHRYAADGSPVWPHSVTVTEVANAFQQDQTLRPDGDGGLVLAYREWTGADLDIGAQRLAADGSRLWSGQGVSICDAAQSQWNPRLEASSDGHLVVVWNDDQVRAQKLTVDGQVLWQANGVLVGVGSDEQAEPQVVADDDGGCFVYWIDGSAGLYGQRLDASGARQWTDAGLAVDDADVIAFDLVPDTAGGGIVGWTVESFEPVLRVNRIGADGSKLWGELDVSPAEAPGGRHQPVLAPDGAGGAFVAWRDSRRPCSDIYAQHLSAGGAVLWDPAGVMVAAFDGMQNFPQIIASGPDELTAMWTDYGADDGLYALRLGEDGSGVTTECVDPTDVETPRPALRLLGGVPNPFNPRTTIRFELDADGPTRLDVHDVRGRRVARLVEGSLAAGPHSVEWEARDERGHALATGVYLVRLVQGSQVALSKVMLAR